MGALVSFGPKIVDQGKIVRIPLESRDNLLQGLSISAISMEKWVVFELIVVYLGLGYLRKRQLHLRKAVGLFL